MLLPSLVLMLQAATATAPVGPLEHSSGVIEHGRVMSELARPTIASGVMLVWLDMDIEFEDGQRQTVYLLYRGSDQALPIRGSICRISYSFEYIDGTTTHGAENRTELRGVVNELQCHADP
jgi:hypothetical protein